MKLTISAAICLVIVGGYIIFSSEQPPSVKQVPSQSNARTVSADEGTTSHFNISGMHCESCSGDLTSELTRVDGVISAKVSLETKIATVTFDTKQTSNTSLLQVISEAGFSGVPVSQ